MQWVASSCASAHRSSPCLSSARPPAALSRSADQTAPGSHAPGSPALS